MKSIAPLDFSHVIAFLLPGFVALFSLNYVSPMVARIVEGSLSGESDLGVVFVLILFSLAAGIVVSAARSLILDKLQFCTGIEKPSLDYAKLTDKETRAAFDESIANTYRFAQFYGNLFIAMSMLTITTVSFGSSKLHWSLYVTLLATLLVLFFAHRGQLESYNRIWCLRD